MANIRLVFRKGKVAIYGAAGEITSSVERLEFVHVRNQPPTIKAEFRETDVDLEMVVPDQPVKEPHPPTSAKKILASAGR